MLPAKNALCLPQSWERGFQRDEKGRRKIKAVIRTDNRREDSAPAPFTASHLMYPVDVYSADVHTVCACVS